MPQKLLDRVLLYLDRQDFSCDTLEISSDLNENHQNIVGAVKSLECLGTDIIRVTQRSRTQIKLTREGENVAENGSHEAIVFAEVPSGNEGIIAEELMLRTGHSLGQIGLSKAIAAGWLKTTTRADIDKGRVIRVIRLVETIEDAVKHQLEYVLHGNISELKGSTLADLKKRKLITRNEVTYFKIVKGSGFSLDIMKQESELTAEMLLNGSWKHQKFKKYNFDSRGSSLPTGNLHPLLKMRSEIRSILVELGFSEIPSNRWVESSFWNFDALFVPQKHPARDAQDTFFMTCPENANPHIPQELLDRVKAAHLGQNFNTEGYGLHWKEEDSYRNCLRTHTTAVTARMLHAIASEKEFKPQKMFSIDRVYRNESLDRTHLAEFFQIEGVIVDHNLSLGNLLAVLKMFYERIGLSKLRFKPAYNPYTEPSMEVFAYHDQMKRWIEVGNSGIFRPEVLLPLGLPKNVRAIAWGLSLERPTMIRYGISNIRSLAGHRVDLKMVYENPICWLHNEKKESKRYENEK